MVAAARGNAPGWFGTPREPSDLLDRVDVADNVPYVVGVVLGESSEATIDLTRQVEDCKLIVCESMRLARRLVNLIGHPPTLLGRERAFGKIGLTPSFVTRFWRPSRRTVVGDRRDRLRENRLSRCGRPLLPGARSGCRTNEDQLAAIAADVREIVERGDTRQIKALLQAYVKEVRVFSRSAIYPSYYAPTVAVSPRLTQ
jgi:hypothetical protein